MDRRAFLKQLGAMGLGMMTLPWWAGCNKHLPEGARKDLAHIRVPEWTGDTFGPMHRIRDGETLPIPKPSQTVDVVIVGGGLSGLTAAYQLRHENILLLERENTLGGNAKQGTFRGIPYALGSAYLVDVDEPYGPLYDVLGLTLKPIASPVDTYWTQGHWTEFEKGSVAQGFQALQQHFRDLLSHPDFPGIPIAAASANAIKLDMMNFYDYLKADYPPELLKLVDAYCYSALGGSIREISAFAGVNFYSEIAGHRYAFPGGNATVAQRFLRHIDRAGQQRFKTGVSVYRVVQYGDTVHTSCFHNQDPEHCVTIVSKAVILAVPYFFAARMLPQLPSAQRQIMQSLQYGSYLVANCCFDQPVFTGGYDNWLPNSPVMTDIIDAGYVTRNNPNTANVLTIYAPFRNPGLGRAKLLQGDAQTFAREIHGALRQMIPTDHLAEIRLTRYGHQLLTSKVGVIRQLQALQKHYGRIVLSHSDGQGMAAIESAVWEGLAAAKAVTKQLG